MRQAPWRRRLLLLERLRATGLEADALSLEAVASSSWPLALLLTKPSDVYMTSLAEALEQSLRHSQLQAARLLQEIALTSLEGLKSRRLRRIASKWPSKELVAGLPRSVCGSRLQNLLLPRQCSRCCSSLLGTKPPQQHALPMPHPSHGLKASLRTSRCSMPAPWLEMVQGALVPRPIHRELLLYLQGH